MSASSGGGKIFFVVFFCCCPSTLRQPASILFWDNAKTGDSPEFGFDTVTVWLSTVNTAIRICHFDWAIVADLSKLLQPRRQSRRSVVVK